MGSTSKKSMPRGQKRLSHIYTHVRERDRKLFARRATWHPAHSVSPSAFITHPRAPTHDSVPQLHYPFLGYIGRNNNNTHTSRSHKSFPVFIIYNPISFFSAFVCCRSLGQLFCHSVLDMRELVAGNFIIIFDGKKRMVSIALCVRCTRSRRTQNNIFTNGQIYHFRPVVS